MKQRSKNVGTGLTVAGVVALLLAFGLATAATAAPCEEPAALQYVSLGDSYSSGFGIGDNQGLCFRSLASNFPKKIQAAKSYGSFIDVSCSGAETSDFYTSQNNTSPPQLNSLSDTTDIVTFTIGGNDLGFTGIIKTCVTSPDCRSTYGGPTMPGLLNKVTDIVGPAVQQAMQDAATEAPNAEIFVLGYPDLLPAGPTGSAWPSSCGFVSLAISDEERNALRPVQAALNQEVEARAAAAGARVHYVDTYTPSIGHDLCSASKWTSIEALFHPSVLGHNEMAAIAVASIDQVLVDPCAASTTTTSTSTTTSTTSTTAPASSTTTSSTTSFTAPAIPTPTIIVAGGIPGSTSSTAPQDLSTSTTPGLAPDGTDTNAPGGIGSIEQTDSSNPAVSGVSLQGTNDASVAGQGLARTGANLGQLGLLAFLLCAAGSALMLGQSRLRRSRSS